jgi:hypothetical protein
MVRPALPQRRQVPEASTRLLPGINDRTGRLRDPSSRLRSFATLARTAGPDKGLLSSSFLARRGSNVLVLVLAVRWTVRLAS